MMRQRILAGFILSLMTVASNAALLGRAPLTPGGTDYRAYFDSALNITWLYSANYPYDSGVLTNSGGQITYSIANSFLSGMNATHLLNVSSWRMPRMDVNGDGTIVDCHTDTEANCRDNELGYMFWQNHVTGVDYTTWGPFYNVVGGTYWSSSICTIFETPGYVSVFSLHTGTSSCGQSFTLGASHEWLWLVASGDPLVSTVPAPPAAWLLGSALGLFGWMRRQSRQATRRVAP